MKNIFRIAFFVTNMFGFHAFADKIFSNNFEVFAGEHASKAKHKVFKVESENYIFLASGNWKVSEISSNNPKSNLFRSILASGNWSVYSKECEYLKCDEVNLRESLVTSDEITIILATGNWSVKEI